MKYKRIILLWVFLGSAMIIISCLNNDNSYVHGILTLIAYIYLAAGFAVGVATGILIGKEKHNSEKKTSIRKVFLVCWFAAIIVLIIVININSNNIHVQWLLSTTVVYFAGIGTSVAISLGIEKYITKKNY